MLSGHNKAVKYPDKLYVNIKLPPLGTVFLIHLDKISSN